MIPSFLQISSLEREIVTTYSSERTVILLFFFFFDNFVLMVEVHQVNKELVMCIFNK